MDFIVPVSAGERAQGELNPSTARAAFTAMASHGAVLLRGAFDPDAIDVLRAEFEAQFGRYDLAGMQALTEKGPVTAVTEVGKARFEIVPRLIGALGPDCFANRLILKFLLPLLGNDFCLSGVTAVASYPGADAQRMHRDNAHLFPDRNVGPQLPVYAVNVSVPLVDVDASLGPTGIWPGSHRWPENAPPPPGAGMAVVPFQRGDAILIDYRTLHAGMPNQADRPRPILYMVYARPWFFDDVNHPGRSPLNMTLKEFEALPDNLKSLLQRAHVQALRGQFLAGSSQRA